MQTAAFTNTYSKSGEGEAKVQKTLSGRAWTTADSFEFTITPVGDAPAFPNATVTVTKNSTNFTESFGKVTFTEAGTYEWTVSEAHKGETINGVAYDSADKTITIVVVDDGNGNLVADEGSALVQTAAFTNTYGKSGEAEIKVQKTLSGRDWTTNDSFKFTITAGEGSPAFEPNEITITKDDVDEDGNYIKSFGTVTFTEEGTYSWTIEETNKGQTINGISYDGHTETVTISVTDNGNGKLVDANNEDHIVKTAAFTNTYAVSNKTQFFAKKILKGRDSFTDGDFSFILKGDKLPDEGETKYAKADRTPVAFSEITYNQDDLNGVAVTEDAEGNKVRTKTFYYTIQEVIPEEDDEKFDPAITYDTHVENNTVTITDDLKGNLDVKVNPENATAAVTFTNIVTKIGKIGNDEEGNKISLGGAHLEVWAPGGSEPVDAWTTEAGELYEIEGLKVGKVYTLKETVVPIYPDDDRNAPAQYYKFAGDTTFTVDENGGITVTGDALKLEQVAGETVLMLNNELAKKPEFEKKIKDTNDSTGETNGWQDSADYDIDDEVPYRLTATLADNVTDYRNYHITFKDEMEKGLTFNGVSLVTVNGRPATDYELNVAEDKHSFDLTLTWIGKEGAKITDESLNKAKVEVYFTAKLTGDAVKFGKEGNVNTAWLEYSCNPSVNDSGDQSEETEETEEDSVIAFTYKVVVNKVDEGGKDALKGAQFTLEKKIKGSATNKVIACVEANPDATFTFEGLDDGEYVLTETKTPDGYKPIDPVTFTVEAVHNPVWDVTNRDQVAAKRKDVLTSLNGVYIYTDKATGEEVKSNKITGLIEFIPFELSELSGLAMNVTNTSESTTAIIRKIWDDDDNRDRTRPAGLVVKLLADGKDTGRTAKLNAENHWADRISGIPMMSHGKKIEYTWEEPKVDGYTMKSNRSTDGILTTLTNTYEIEKVKISVEKFWNDNDNKAGARPTSIDVQLYADGVAVGGVVTLSADNNWFHTWPELPKNVNETGVKREIKYSVNETEIPEGYIGKVTKTISKEDGSKTTKISFKITNTYENGKLIIEKEFDIAPWEPFTPDDSPMDIPVIKTWNDNNNKDGNRPASVVVRLLANGTQVAIAELNAGNNWRYTFAGMPRIDENKEKIEYTITEDPVDWYKAQINGFNIRNNYEPELTSVTVTKIWDDANNEMQARPESIVMTLSNGMTVLLNDQNNWTATINDLPTRVNGAPANYTWTEQKVLGYDKVAEVTEGSVTTFMNRRWVRPATPNRGGTPKTAGETVYEFDEYETPLGVDIVINHVGDCFD